MKNTYNREWLENYKVIPKTDNTIYKNYQNPSMNNWDRQMATLSPTQRGKYDQFLNTIPSELQGLSAIEMQKYLQNVDEKQNVLTHERAGYESQIQKVKNDEIQRQTQLRAQQAPAPPVGQPPRVQQSRRVDLRAYMEKQIAEIKNNIAMANSTIGKAHDNPVAREQVMATYNNTLNFYESQLKNLNRLNDRGF